MEIPANGLRHANIKVREIEEYGELREVKHVERQRGRERQESPEWQRQVRRCQPGQKYHRRAERQNGTAMWTSTIYIVSGHKRQKRWQQRQCRGGIVQAERGTNERRRRRVRESERKGEYGRA